MYGQTINPPPGVTQGVIGGESLTDFVLSPSSTVISFGDITIYRIGAGSMAPSSALPIGAQRVLSEMQPVLVDPGSSGAGLHNAVMGLLAPANPDENERYEGDILDLPIVAFVVMWVAFCQFSIESRREDLSMLIAEPTLISQRRN